MLDKANQISQFLPRIAQKTWNVNQDVLIHNYQIIFASIACYGAKWCGEASIKNYINKLVNAEQMKIFAFLHSSTQNYFAS